MKSIALLSSGLDSVVATTRANNEGRVELALTFDYGQRAAVQEIFHASKVCEILGIKHRVIKIPWLSEISKSALTDLNSEIPEPADRELDIKEITEETAKQVWVPNRNGVFINIAASFAEAIEADAIIVGFDVEEAVTFPDNSRSYVEAVNTALSFSTMNKVKVTAPVINLNKSEIVALGLEINAPLEWSWSCYYGSENPCMKCESCRRRERAFRSIGFKDPLKKRLGMSITHD